MPIENVRQLIRSKFHIRPDVGSCPPHTHLSGGNGLKLEVPLPRLHRVELLSPENADLLGSDLGQILTGCVRRIQKEAEVKQCASLQAGLTILGKAKLHL